MADFDEEYMSHLSLSTVFTVICTAVFLIGCAGQDFDKARNTNTIAAYDAFLSKHPSGAYSQKAKEKRDRLVEQIKEKHQEWIAQTKKQGMAKAAHSLCRETAGQRETGSAKQLLAPYYIHISKPPGKWACEKHSHADCYHWTKEDLNKKLRSSWTGPDQENTVVVCIEENQWEQVEKCSYSGGHTTFAYQSFIPVRIVDPANRVTIAKTKLYGGLPSYNCIGTMTFTPGESIRTFHGRLPSFSALSRWLMDVISLNPIRFDLKAIDKERFFGQVWKYTTFFNGEKKRQHYIKFLEDGFISSYRWFAPNKWKTENNELIIIHGTQSDHFRHDALKNAFYFDASETAAWKEKKKRYPQLGFWATELIPVDKSEKLPFEASFLFSNIPKK